MGLHIDNLNCRIRVSVPFEEDQVPMTRALGAPVGPPRSAPRRGGFALDETALFQLETMMGQGFRDIRIHTGPEAREAARKMGAAAFQVAENVYFDEGRFDPQTPEGLGLLAHELTHVVQRVEGRTREEREAEAREVERTYRRKADRPAREIDLGIETGASGTPEEQRAEEIPMTARLDRPTAAPAPAPPERPASSGPSSRTLATLVLERMARDQTYEEERRGLGGLD